MADRRSQPVSCPTVNAVSQTSRSKKRTRQRSNQQKRARAHDAYIVFTQEPTYGNAFRAWMAWAEERHTPQELRSANKFARALRTLSAANTGEPDYPETERITADTLVQCVEDLAWTLNAKFTLKENAGKTKTPTSRISTNFRSLVDFLIYARVFSHDDLSYLLDACGSLAEDLERATRVNRIMESYTWYIQEAYFDTGKTVDESYWGEYEVENIRGKRVLVLRKFDPKGDPETRSLGFRSFSTHFPAPLVDVVKLGDTLTLQICHLDQAGMWVPYMYSGFTPTRDDCGTRTPTDRSQRSPDSSHSPSSPFYLRDDDHGRAMSELQSSLARLEVSPTRQSQMQPQTQGRAHGTTQSAAVGHTYTGGGGANARRQSPVAAAEFSFNESQFTEEYYKSWEGDIDTDEDIAGIGQLEELEYEGDVDEFRGYPTSPASSSSGGSARSPHYTTNTGMHHALRGHLC